MPVTDNLSAAAFKPGVMIRTDVDEKQPRQQLRSICRNEDNFQSFADHSKFFRKRTPRSKTFRASTKCASPLEASGRAVALISPPAELLAPTFGRRRRKWLLAFGFERRRLMQAGLREDLVGIALSPHRVRV